MFHVGEIIVYGIKGVYKVESIGMPGIRWLDSSKIYYTLFPLYREEKVFIPVDTEVFMRPVISYEDAEKLILSIPRITVLENDCRNPRSLEASYQAAFDKHELEELIRIIKKTYAKREKAIRSGKKLAQIDERYMKRAESLLFEELSVALGIPINEVPSYINKKLGNEASFIV